MGKQQCSLKEKKIEFFCSLRSQMSSSPAHLSDLLTELKILDHFLVLFIVQAFCYVLCMAGYCSWDKPCNRCHGNHKWGVQANCWPIRRSYYPASHVSGLLHYHTYTINERIYAPQQQVGGSLQQVDIGIYTTNFCWEHTLISINKDTLSHPFCDCLFFRHDP